MWKEQKENSGSEEQVKDQRTLKKEKMEPCFGEIEKDYYVNVIRCWKI